MLRVNAYKNLSKQILEAKFKIIGMQLIAKFGLQKKLLNFFAVFRLINTKL